MGMEKQGLAWRYSMKANLCLLPCRTTLRQLLSYALIGVLTNILGYVLYIGLTQLSGAPKLTMTLLYGIGSIIGFLANRRFTFGHNGHIGAAGVRYLLVQFAGYLINLFLLIFFTDWLGFSHQIVQAIAVVVVAIFLFILFRTFVFPPYKVENGATPS